MAVLVDVTTFPQTFAAGTWPTSTLNTGRFQITITVSLASSSGSFPNGNFWAVVVANDNGGLWFFKTGGGTMRFGMFNASTGATIWEHDVTWAAGATMTLDVDHVASTYSISGAATGNVTGQSFTAGGNAYTSSTLGVGVYGGGGFTWSGSASDITDGVTGYTIAADAGAVAIAGTDATLLDARRLAADAGALALTGTVADLLFGRRLAADAGAVALVGMDANLVYGSNDPILQAEPGAVALPDFSAGLIVARRLDAEAGAVGLAGADAGLVHGFPLAADAGAIQIGGTAAELLATRQLAADTGAVALAAPAEAALTVGAALSVGATGIDFQIFGLANRDASVVMDTQPTGSFVFVVSGGQTSDVTQGVTDSFANDWNRRPGNQGTQDYPDFPGYGIVIETTANPMAGGDDHEFNVPVELFDENTTIAIEVIGGRRVAASTWRNVPNSSGSTTLVTDPITVDRATVLIAICGGSGPVFSPNTTPFQLTPDAAWTPGPSYLVNNVNGEVQMASAYRLVSAGTYTCTWTLFPSQGAQMPVYAIQAAAIIPIEQGEVPITGTAAGLAHGVRLAADAGAVPIAGVDATLRRGQVMPADSGAVPIVGADAILLAGRRLAADTIAIDIAGQQADLRLGLSLAAEAGAVALAAPPAALLAGRRLDAAAGVVDVVGTAAALLAARRLQADTTSVDIGAQLAELTRAALVAALSGTLPISGTNADLVWSGQGQTFTLDAEAGALPITGTDAVLPRTWRLTADPGAVAVTGTQAALVWSAAAAPSWAGVRATLEFVAARHLGATLEAQGQPYATLETS